MTERHSQLVIPNKLQTGLFHPLKVSLGFFHFKMDVYKTWARPWRGHGPPICPMAYPIIVHPIFCNFTNYKEKIFTYSLSVQGSSAENSSDSHWYHFFYQTHPQAVLRLIFN